MLKGGVEMSLLPQLNHLGEVLVVNMCVDTEQALQDGLGDRQEVLGERHADLGWEQCLVVQLVLHPRHQVVYVLGCRAFNRLLHCVAVRPVILVLGPRRHDGATILRAELSNGPVEHVDLVEEVHGVHGHPFVQVLSVWQHDGQPQVARAQRGGCVLHQVILVRSLGDVLLRLEGLVGPTAAISLHPS